MGDGRKSAQIALYQQHGRKYARIGNMRENARKYARIGAIRHRKYLMHKISILLSALVLSACGGGDDAPAASAGNPPPATSTNPPVASVSMAKSLGTLQCAVGGTTPAVLQGQLTSAGVRVLSSACGNDGMMRPAVCGASDGAIAIFDIPATQQAAAQALNFAPLGSLPDAVKVPCK